ncbi:hypothetical protein ACLBOM_37785 [Escherichia coli]
MILRDVKIKQDISLNKSLEDGKTYSPSLQYSHRQLLDQRTSNYYTLSLNRYFDAFGLKNISAGVSASRSRYYQKEAIVGEHITILSTYAFLCRGEQARPVTAAV